MPKLLLKDPKNHDGDMLVLSLEKHLDGSVTLYGRDSQEREWALLNLSAQGLVGRHMDIPKLTGLAVTKKGKLKLDKTFEEY